MGVRGKGEGGVGGGLFSIYWWCDCHLSPEEEEKTRPLFFSFFFFFPTSDLIVTIDSHRSPNIIFIYVDRAFSKTGVLGESS